MGFIREVRQQRLPKSFVAFMVMYKVLDVSKCVHWFCKFRSGDVDLSDGHHSGRPVKLDNDLLRSEVKSDSVKPSNNYHKNSTLCGLVFKNTLIVSRRLRDKAFGFATNSQMKTKHNNLQSVDNETRMRTIS